MQDDEYKTIAAPVEAALRERSSKFLAYAWPVKSEEEIKNHLDALRKKYYDATHHCYAWRLGPRATCALCLRLSLSLRLGLGQYHGLNPNTLLQKILPLCDL